MIVRVAELLGAFSLAIDLANGLAREKSLRTTVIATRLALAAGAPLHEVRATFWTALLRYVGSTAFAHEEGLHFSAGDDIGLRRTLAFVDFGRPQTFVTHAVRDVAAHAPLTARVKAVAKLLSADTAKHRAAAQSEAGAYFAHRFGMPEIEPFLALRGARFDRHGLRTHDEPSLPLAVRCADVADTLELFAWHFGISAAKDELTKRSGGELDPAIVSVALREGPRILRDAFTRSAREGFLASEPQPVHTLTSEEELSRLLDAFSGFADLASTFTLGHSRRVAELAANAARECGLDESDVTLARHGGFVHDVGRVGVANGIWEKPAELTPYERERVRTHSRHTETVLREAKALSTIADIAAATHERGASAGYHRRLSLEHLPMSARVLAAADVYVALRSERPHRRAYDTREAEKILLDEALVGGLDRRAVLAVLDAARQTPLRHGSWPARLSDREVEVVRCVAVGRDAKEIAAMLALPLRAAREHVTTVFDKVGVESRAALALFAMEHRLLDP